MAEIILARLREETLDKDGIAAVSKLPDDEVDDMVQFRVYSLEKRFIVSVYEESNEGN